MIEVFKTNVDSRASAHMLSETMKNKFGYDSISFDLGDCDRGLRVESAYVDFQDIIVCVISYGFACELLVD